ncbi:hypothetical protein AM493_08645 [Flavobacterium akiainvivens]|uniref:Uncharacterized protein n=1 Tax=Flavobacterium akiainvivens TaxID=1202724 RepID=A0A0M8MI86_9FLAO|nr:hypothetical protein [Flavobacterium akiainvivens]KOS06098.1 hypothetical protein AM493_08645 [Flavobacterium akiainvivens]SFQ54912.1 hypothetical protein SAMN05444144_107212 [Flavobacterium akiainvivens]
MELREIETLLDKYFDAETTIAEENTLKAYFAAGNIAPHLAQYAPMFGYFAAQQEQHFDKPLPLKTKVNYTKWLSVAASLVLLCGMLAWFINTNPPQQQQELGTYDDPEVAFRETQKALGLLSSKVNMGVKGVNYLGEYERAKQTVFKE